MASFVRKPLLVRKGLAVFQNALLLTKSFPVTLGKYYAFLTDLVYLLQIYYNLLFKEVEMFPQLNCDSLGLCIYGEIRDTLLKVLQIIGNIIYTSLSFRRDIENLLSIFFSIRLSFSQTLTIYRTAGEEKIDYFLFHCTTSSLSQTFRYLFATCM